MLKQMVPLLLRGGVLLGVFAFLFLYPVSFSIGSTGSVGQIQGKAGAASEEDAEVRALGKGASVKAGSTITTDAKSKLLLDLDPARRLSMAELAGIVLGTPEDVAAGLPGVTVSEGVVRFVGPGGAATEAISDMVATAVALIQPPPDGGPVDFIVQVFNEKKTAVTVLSGKVVVRNATVGDIEGKVVEACLTIDIEENRKLSEPFRAPPDAIKDLIQQTTIAGTLPSEFAPCMVAEPTPQEPQEPAEKPTEKPRKVTGVDPSSIGGNPGDDCIWYPFPGTPGMIIPWPPGPPWPPPNVVIIIINNNNGVIWVLKQANLVNQLKADLAKMKAVPKNQQPPLQGKNLKALEHKLGLEKQKLIGARNTLKDMNKQLASAGLNRQQIAKIGSAANTPSNQQAVKALYTKGTVKSSSTIFGAPGKLPRVQTSTRNPRDLQVKQHQKLLLKSRETVKQTATSKAVKSGRETEIIITKPPSSDHKPKVRTGTSRTTTPSGSQQPKRQYRGYQPSGSTQPRTTTPPTGGPLR